MPYLNFKCILIKARKARMSDKDTSCYIYIPHGNTHSTNTLHSHTFFSFFPAIPTTEHGERSRVRAEKTAQRSCSGFFQIRTCEALDGFGVWSYLCRLKREKNTVRFTNADWSNDTLFRYDFFKNRYTYGREV